MKWQDQNLRPPTQHLLFKQSLFLYPDHHDLNVFWQPIFKWNYLSLDIIIQIFYEMFYELSWL